MKILKGDSAIDALMGVLPYVLEALPDDMSLYVTDGKKYLEVAEGSELKLGITAGSEVMGKATEKCMTENRKTVFNVRTGLQFRGVNVPIPDENGRPVGTVICASGRQKQQDVNEVANQLSDFADQIALAIEEIARGAGRLAQVGQSLSDKAVESNQKIKETGVIINTIKEISGQTNLLGLNAAIESARAGEHGRGFGVVAEEIRKLADNSKEAAERVREIIDSISAVVGEMTNAATESAAIAQQQAASTEENAATIEQLRQLAVAVKNTAAKL
ncbi:methyl-accepting chemotaxis protein [Dehalobacter sp. DCM]|uniref:methyl-accepting chemotaxis protein n=1 Tax=Dehalobacter sp. DCM TaxID=2907827 RepID=UPI0030821E9B